MAVDPIAREMISGMHSVAAPIANRRFAPCEGNIEAAFFVIDKTSV
jgi:hypothetical protein